MRIESAAKYQNNSIEDSVSSKILALIPLIGHIFSMKISDSLEKKMGVIDYAKFTWNDKNLFGSFLNNFKSEETSEYLQLMQVRNDYRLLDGVRWTLTAGGLAALSYPIFSIISLVFAGIHYYSFFDTRAEILEMKQN